MQSSLSQWHDERDAVFRVVDLWSDAREDLCLHWGTNPYVNSPTYGLLLDGDPVSGFPGLNSFRNNHFKKDYAVLKIATMVLPAYKYSGQARQKPFSFSYKIPQKYALGEYKGASNSDLINPAIYCVAVTTNGLTSNYTGVDIVFQNRIYYTDI